MYNAAISFKELRKRFDMVCKQSVTARKKSLKIRTSLSWVITYYYHDGLVNCRELRMKNREHSSGNFMKILTGKLGMENKTLSAGATHLMKTYVLRKKECKFKNRAWSTEKSFYFGTSLPKKLF